MDLPKTKNGKLILNMLEIGKTIKNTDLVYNFMVMEINMKVGGKKTKETDKEHSGFQKEKISKI